MTSAKPVVRGLAVVGLAFLVMALNVGASVLYMVLYGYVIAPGHEEAYYQAHAQVAAPWSSVIVGIPLMFFAARWSAPRLGRRAAVSIAIVYVVVDLAIMLGAGALGQLAFVVTLSVATKLGAAWLGARGRESQTA
jgi:hypothetical protein